MIDQKLTQDSREVEPDSEELSDSTGSPQDALDARRGIFIRLSPLTKQILEDAKKDMGVRGVGQKTYTGVVERLLEYYGEQPSKVRKNILSGSSTNTLKDSQDYLARLHRAQHAFETKRYYFAIKTYSEIAESLDGSDSSEELLDVCRFRLAHSWNQLSYRLRVEALGYYYRQDAQKESEKYYEQALVSLEYAVGCLKKLKDDDDELMALIKNYNMACCYSLRAQYLIESRLKPSSTEVDFSTPLRTARKQRKETEDLWLGSIGLHWHEMDTDGAVNQAAKDALYWLERIYPRPGNESDSRSSKKTNTNLDSIWIVNEAKEDPDFLFLRSAEIWKDEFKKWEASASKGASLAIVIEDLQKGYNIP